MPRYYSQHDQFLFWSSCSSCLPAKSQQPLGAEGRKHGCSDWASPWGSRDTRASGPLQDPTVRAVKELTGWETESQDALESWERCAAIALTTACFSPHPSEWVVGWIHHRAYGYSLCGTYCSHKCQLFGSWKKFGQAPLEDAVWSRADVSSLRHSIFRAVFSCLSAEHQPSPGLKIFHFDHNGCTSRKSSWITITVQCIRCPPENRGSRQSEHSDSDLLSSGTDLKHFATAQAQGFHIQLWTSL